MMEPKEKRHAKCFGKHCCWNQVELQCVDRKECLLQWGLNNIMTIEELNPPLAKRLKLIVVQKESKKEKTP